MKKVFISIITIIALVLSLVITTPKVNAAETETNAFDELVTTIEGYITDGTLPSWHSAYKENPYYHKYITHYIQNDILDSFASQEQSGIETFLTFYEDKSLAIKNKIMIEEDEILNVITTNQSLGFYFDGINLYFLWTSKYLPTSYLTLSSITLNIDNTSKTFAIGDMTDENVVCSHLNGDPMSDVTEQIYFPENNLQINATQLAFYHLCSTDKQMYTGGITYNNKDYNIMDMDSITVEKFTAYTPSDCYFQVNETITDKPTFEIIKKCEYEGSEVLSTKLLKYADIETVGIQLLNDRYRVVFNCDYLDNYINKVYLYAKVKHEGKQKECAILRNKDQIGHYEDYDFIEISKEEFEILEIKLLRISVWNSSTTSEITNYDTIYSTANSTKLKTSQMQNYAISVLWNHEDESKIAEIPEEVENFTFELPKKDTIIEFNEDDSKDDQNDNSNNDTNINDNNKPSEDDKPSEDNNDDVKDESKMDKVINVLLTVLLTSLLVFVLIKIFSFVKKMLK